MWPEQSAKARIGLYIVPPWGRFEKCGWHFFCSFSDPAFIIRGILFKTGHHCKLWKAVLANQDGIWKIIQIRPIEILCTNLHDVWTKSIGVIAKNVLCKNRPAGGAITGYEKMWATALTLQGVFTHSFTPIGHTVPKISCSQMEGRTHARTDARTHAQTDRGEYIASTTSSTCRRQKEHTKHILVG